MSPQVGEDKLARVAMDHHICSRAQWLIEVCESSEIHILNGIGQTTPAPYTCYTHAGNSTVDYIMSNLPATTIQYDREPLQRLSDHTLLYTDIPLSQAWQNRYETSKPTPQRTWYSWIEGTSVYDYAASA